MGLGDAIREAMNCPFLQLGFPCVHPNQTHEMISEAFRQPDVFDPLKLQPANRTVALAVMVGVVLLQYPLYQPATSKIQSTAAQPNLDFKKNNPTRDLRFNTTHLRKDT
jgi:hypothetical protein